MTSSSRSLPIARVRPAALFLALGFALSLDVSAATFTYDGRLDDAGRPANGQYDIQLRPWNTAEKGLPLAPAISFSRVKVSDGHFRVDFDVPLSNSDQAWLELAVRDAGSSADYTPILGRMKAVSTPLIGQCWSSTGDSGTNQAINFLGTTDDNALVLRTNNQRSLQLQSSTVLANNIPITSNVLAGSSANVISATVRGATIAGGGILDGGNTDPDFTSEAPNFVTDHYGTVGGGFGNTAGNFSGTLVDGSVTTVSGGSLNSANSRGSAVGGGEENNALGVRATIAGGLGNYASGDHATVVGGFRSTASGSFSTVGGGANNCAGGESSWAGGTQAKVRRGTASGNAGDGCSGVTFTGDANGDEGTFVWSDSQAPAFASTGPNQFLARAGGGVGINTSSIPSHAEMVLTNRPTGGNNVDLVMRSNLNNNGFNIAMSPNPAGAELFIAQYDGTTFTNRLTLSFQGDLSVFAAAIKPGGGSWSASSDARLKSDVQPMHGTLDRLLSLRGVTFRYTNPDPAKRPAGTHDGLIAQEVAKVFPQWVNTDSEGYLTVGSQGFEALAVEALRDLRAEKDIEIKALALENAELRNRLDQIETVLGELRQRSER